MKILIIQENGRHDANRIFRECHNFKRSFDRLGIESEIWGLGHNNFDVNFDDLQKEYDVLFIIENYDETNWLSQVSKSNKFKVFWSIDSHCNLNGNLSTCEKLNVNLVLNSIESDMLKFKRYFTEYFPNAYPSDLIKPLENIDKNNLIGFCGTPFHFREHNIDLIEKKLNINVKKDYYVIGFPMVESINSYKIHFNQSLSNDINYRVFETMGCNTLLLTSNIENIDTFFSDMYDIVTYKSEDEMIEKIKYLQNNEEEIIKISNNGYQNVIKNHTFDNRTKELINIIKKHI